MIVFLRCDKVRLGRRRALDHVNAWWVASIAEAQFS